MNMLPALARAFGVEPAILERLVEAYENPEHERRAPQPDAPAEALEERTREVGKIAKTAAAKAVAVWATNQTLGVQQRTLAECIIDNALAVPRPAPEPQQPDTLAEAEGQLHDATETRWGPLVARSLEATAAMKEAWYRGWVWYWFGVTMVLLGVLVGLVIRYLL